MFDLVPCICNNCYGRIQTWKSPFQKLRDERVKKKKYCLNETFIQIKLCSLYRFGEERALSLEFIYGQDGIFDKCS